MKKKKLACYKTLEQNIQKNALRISLMLMLTILLGLNLPKIIGNSRKPWKQRRTKQISQLQEEGISRNTLARTMKHKKKPLFQSRTSISTTRVKNPPGNPQSSKFITMRSRVPSKFRIKLITSGINNNSKNKKSNNCLILILQ